MTIQPMRYCINHSTNEKSEHQSDITLLYILPLIGSFLYFPLHLQINQSTNDFVCTFGWYISLLCTLNPWILSSYILIQLMRIKIACIISGVWFVDFSSPNVAPLTQQILSIAPINPPKKQTFDCLFIS